MRETIVAGWRLTEYDIPGCEPDASSTEPYGPSATMSSDRLSVSHDVPADYCGYTTETVHVPVEVVVALHEVLYDFVRDR